MTAEGRAGLVGAIDPEKSVPAVRGHVRAFFGEHLAAASGTFPEGVSAPPTD